MHRVRASNQAWWAAGRSTFCSSDRSASSAISTGPAVCGKKPEVIFISSSSITVGQRSFDEKTSIDEKGRNGGVDEGCGRCAGPRAAPLPRCPAAPHCHCAAPYAAQPCIARAVLRAAAKPVGVAERSPAASDAMRAVLKAVDSDAAAVIRDANDVIFSRVSDFVATHTVASSEAARCIPACVLISGVNLQDHHSTLRVLSRSLKKRCPATVTATLTPHNAQSVAGMLGALLFQLIHSRAHAADEQAIRAQGAAGGTKDDVPALLAGAGVQHGSMQNIRQWFASMLAADGLASGTQGQCRAAPASSAPAINHARPHAPRAIVILLEEIESFDPDLLNEFLGVLYEERGSLPLALVLQLSSTRHQV